MGSNPIRVTFNTSYVRVQVPPELLNKYIKKKVMKKEKTVMSGKMESSRNKYRSKHGNTDAEKRSLLKRLKRLFKRDI